MKNVRLIRCDLMTCSLNFEQPFKICNSRMVVNHPKISLHKEVLVFNSNVFLGPTRNAHVNRPPRNAHDICVPQKDNTVRYQSYLISHLTI